MPEKKAESKVGQKQKIGGGVFRVKKSKDFSVILNAPMRDTRLSFGARGILAYLLTKPDDWQVRSSDLVEQRKDLVMPGFSGRDMVLKMLKELEVCGYLERERTRDPETGQYGWETTIYEIPRAGSLSEKVASPKTPEPTQVEATTKEELSGRKASLPESEISDTDTFSASAKNPDVSEGLIPESDISGRSGSNLDNDSDIIGIGDEVDEMRAMSQYVKLHGKEAAMNWLMVGGKTFVQWRNENQTKG